MNEKRFVAPASGRQDAGHCPKTQERGSFALCNASVSLAELEQSFLIWPAGRRRYRAFSDSLAGGTNEKVTHDSII